MENNNIETNNVENEILEDDFQEYETFMVTDKDGNEIELAIMDEFEVDGKKYVAGALVEADTINEDGVYIYRVEADGEDFEVAKIEDEAEYLKVTEEYMNQ